MKISFTKLAIQNLPIEDHVYEARDKNISGFMVVVRPSGTKSFVYAYRNPQGKKQRITFGRFGTVSVEQAKNLALQAAGEVAKGNDPQKEKVQLRRETESVELNTLKQFIETEYKPYVLKHNKSGSYSLEILNRDFKFLLDKPMTAITASHLERWQIAAMDKDLKATTINRRLACLKAVFTRAVNLSLLEYSPISKVKNVKQLDDNRVRYLGIDEEPRLRAAMRQRDNELLTKRTTANVWRSQRGYELYPIWEAHQFADHLEPMILLAMNTGMRRGELFQLNWLDVDFTNNTLAIRAANTKSSKLRYVPLNKEALRVLNTLKEQRTCSSGLVFKNKNGKKFTDIKKAWSTLLLQAQIDDFRFHDLRHHFASRLVMNGISLNTVRDLLGHADIAITLRYAHLSDDHRRDAVCSLDQEQ